jgi:hypothetical protein
MKNYVLIFNDSSRKWIEDTIANKIIGISTNSGNKIDNVMIGQDMIRLSSIAKLLTRKEFNEQYPKERIEPPLPTYKSLPYISIEKQVEKNPKYYKKMIQGLKRFIDREQKVGHTPLGAMAMYEKKLKKYKLKFGDNIN